MNIIKDPPYFWKKYPKVRTAILMVEMTCKEEAKEIAALGDTVEELAHRIRTVVGDLQREHKETEDDFKTYITIIEETHHPEFTGYLKERFYNEEQQ